MAAGGRNVLIADDDASIRLVLSQALARDGYQVRATGNAATLWKWVKDGDGDLVLTDVMMPDGNVFDYLPRMRLERPGLPIVVMSANNTLLTAVSAAEQGAYDYLPKPFDLDVMLGVVRRALEGRRDLAAVNQQRRAEKEERLPLVGRSAPMQEVYRILSRAAGADVPVLIEGEPGTGKKLVARVLHDYGRRKSGPFRVLSLAALEPARLDDMLTGADGRSGLLAEVDGGTLFLDGLSDAPPATQARLARHLAGFDSSKVRIIAASHADLRVLTASGQFREDLYYRLNVVTIRVPPLRERLDDAADLARAFLARAARDGLGEKALDRSGAEALEAWHWPGNVRELENLMRRLAALSPEALITGDMVRRELSREQAAGPSARAAHGGGDLEEAARDALDGWIGALLAGGEAPSGLYDTVLAAMERPLFERVLKETRGNQLRAADMLGLNRNTLRKRLQNLGVSAARGRQSG